MSEIRIDTSRCKTCGLCELACSFHHIGAFLPEKASIRVGTDHEGYPRIEVLPSCDLCEGEDSPLCAEFCPVDAIQTP